MMSSKQRTLSMLGFLVVTLAAGGCERRESGTAGAEVRRGREGTAQQQPGQTGALPLQPVTAEPIRDVDILVTTTDRLSLLHRQVDVVGAEVQRVSTDRVFWIGPTADRSVAVYVDDAAWSGMQQGQLKIRKGQRLSLVGDLRQAPTVQQMQQLWSVPAEDADLLSKQQVYLNVRRVLIGESGAAPVQQPGTQPGQQPGTQPGQQPGTKPGTKPGQPGTKPGQPGTKPGQPAKGH